MGNGGQTATAEEKKEDVISTVEWSTAMVETPEKRDSPDISGKHSDLTQDSHTLMKMIHRCHECCSVCVTPDETLSFWRGIAEVGLMGEVVSNIRSELLSLLRGVQLRTDQSSLQDAGQCICDRFVP